MEDCELVFQEENAILLLIITADSTPLKEGWEGCL